MSAFTEMSTHNVPRNYFWISVPVKLFRNLPTMERWAKMLERQLWPAGWDRTSDAAFHSVSCRTVAVLWDTEANTVVTGTGWREGSVPVQ